MKVIINIDDKVYPHVCNKTEEELSAILSVLLDIAIRHDLITYPDTTVERNLKSINKDLMFLKTKAATNDSSIEKATSEIIDVIGKLNDKLDLISDKMASLSMEEAIKNSYSNNNTNIDKVVGESEIEEAIASVYTLKNLAEANDSTNVIVSEETKQDLDSLLDNLLNDTLG